MTKHEHCWHYVGGYSNGLGSGGVDDFKCCHCGQIRKRPWKAAPDPEHGPYSGERIKKYTDD